MLKASWRRWGFIIGAHAGDMIGDADDASALAIEMGADAVDIGKTIHPQPTLIDRIGMAAEVAHGSCTDALPARQSCEKVCKNPADRHYST